MVTLLDIGLFFKRFLGVFFFDFFKSNIFSFLTSSNFLWLVSDVLLLLEDLLGKGDVSLSAVAVVV